MIELTVIANWALMVLEGEFDLSNAGGIRAAAADLADQGVTEVTVDLTRVAFFGAAAIGALIAADHLVSAAGGHMIIVGASPFTRRVFAFAGVELSLSVFGLVPEPDLPAPAEDPGPPVGDDELSGLLSQVSRLLLTEATVTGDLQAVVRAAVDLVPGCSAASIALVARSAPHSAAVSDEVAVEVDLAQYATGEGPCLDVTRSADRIRVDAVATDDRFVRFGLIAGRLGINAVLSVPVVAGEVTIGSVNLYSSHGFSVDAGAVGDIIAAQAAAALTKSEIYTAALTLARGVQKRTDDEREANIAAGVLAGFEECSIEQAERLLRFSARRTGESVTGAARRVISFLVGH